MSETHGFGRLYVGTTPLLTGTGKKHFGIEQTIEIEEPWRIGRSLVIRVPFTDLGLVIGWWLGHGEEKANLLTAVGGHEMGHIDFKGSQR